MTELSIVLQKAKPIGEEPKADRKVPLTSLLNGPEKYAAKRYAYVAIQVEDAVYFVRPIEEVPENASVLRDSSGALLGLPMVAGG
ncbi:MAG: hypothetical protein HY619_05045 [Thaumarchaeota archaeon]|nr:hypothetical protein [Nitrososphaerota archaeon]